MTLFILIYEIAYTGENGLNLTEIESKIRKNAGILDEARYAFSKTHSFIYKMS